MQIQIRLGVHLDPGPGVKKIKQEFFANLENYANKMFYISAFYNSTIRIQEAFHKADQKHWIPKKGAPYLSLSMLKMSRTMSLATERLFSRVS